MGRALPSDTQVRRVMSANLVVVHPEDDIDAAFHAFGQHPVRRLPVMDGKSVVGMIALDDLLVLAHERQGELLRPVVSELDGPQSLPA